MKNSKKQALTSTWPAGGCEMGERIRAFAWATTPLGPMETWPQSLKTLVEMTVSCDFPMVILWGPDLVQIYNDGYRALMGIKHPDGLGQPTRQCWPEVWHINEQIYAQVRAGKTLTFEDKLYPITRFSTLEDAWFTLCYCPLRDETGAIVGVLVNVFETTQRHLAESERQGVETDLRASEAKYRALFERVDEGYILTDMVYDAAGAPVDIAFVEANVAALRMIGSELGGRRASEIDPPFGPHWFEIFEHVARTGISERHEFAATPTGASYSCYVFKVEDGHHARVAAIYQDITEHKRHEQQQAYLLRLSDTLRSLADPVAIEEAVTRLAMDYFGADRCYYCSVEGDEAIIRRDALRGDLPSVSGTYPLHSFELLRRVIDEGRPFIVFDTNTTAILDESLRNICLQLQVISFVDVPVVKTGKVIGVLCLVQATPRAWTATEIALATENADRIWAAVERSKAEFDLHQSEARLQATINQAAMGIIEAGLDRRLLHVNPGFSRIIGYSPEEALKLTIDAVTHPADQAADAEMADQLLRGEIPDYTIEKRYIRKAGQAMWVSVTVSLIRDEQGKPSYAVAIIQDIDARKQAEEALRASKADLTERVAAATAELRALSHRLLEVQEEERRYLALELHDDIGQTLTGLQLQLATAARAQNGLGKAALAEAEALVKDLTTRVSALSVQLRPTLVDTLGLLPALHALVESYQRRTGIMVELRHQGSARRFPAEVEIGAYRVMQEALTNVARHADARSVTMYLFADDAVLTVAIHDDGHGFDPALTVGQGGLAGMRERAELLGGTFDIESAPGEGTHVTAEFPLHGKAGDASTKEEPA